MDPQTLAQLQGNILFWIIIAIFAWQGYQRGLISELVKFGFIALGLAVGTPDLMGTAVIKAINGFYLATQFLIHGGLKAIATGNFDAATVSNIFKVITKLPRLVPKNHMDLALFLVMLLLIGMGYIISIFSKTKSPGLGLVAGAINGLMISYIFLPLLPDKAPFTLNDFSPAGIFRQLLALISYLSNATLKGVNSLLDFLMTIFGAWTIPIILLTILIILLTSLKPSRKKSSGGNSASRS